MKEKKINYSYVLRPSDADKLRAMAESVGKTPGIITQELVVAFVNGKIKLPLPENINEVYQ